MRALGTVRRRVEATATWVKLAEAALAGDGPAAAMHMQQLYRNSMQFVIAGEPGFSDQPDKG
jgi:hypothetical protein